MSFRFRPASEEFQRDPHATYDYMRENCPVYVTPNKYVVLTRYEDVAKTLRNDKMSVQYMDYCSGPAGQYVGTIKKIKEENPIVAGFTTMLRVDDPAHDRMKKLTIPVFSHSNIMRLSNRIEAVVDKHIDSVRHKSMVNIVQDLTQGISQDTICNIMNVPEADKERLCHWAHALTMIIEPLQSSTEGVENVQKYLPDTVNYLITEIDKRSKNPLPDDIVTSLIYEEVDGDRLEMHEVISTVGLLFLAGIETTMYFMCNAVAALMNDEEARQDWIDIVKSAENAPMGMYTDPALNNAVEELIRYTGSVWMTARVNIEDVVYDNKGTPVVIEKGSLINTMLAAANRDPEVFENPHKLDLRRHNAKRNIGFSGGPHYCLGSNMAKLETMMFLAKLFTQFPDAHIVGDPIWRDRMTFRGIETLNVALQ